MNRPVDLTTAAVEAWMVRQEGKGMGARTMNVARSSVVAFASWCKKSRRIATNPMVELQKADEASDRRRQRRALTQQEFIRLLDTTRRRPLLEAMTVRRGKNAGKPMCNVRHSVQDHLRRLGWERALIYKTLALTGLRKKELASLTVGQLELNGPRPHAVLFAKDAKNAKAAKIPLTAELVGGLREWLADQLKQLRKKARAKKAPIPLVLPPEAPLFTVPDGLVRILDRDLKLAGIPKKDGRGRTIDVHALRHTFCTWMQMAGVAGRKTQAAMRHSSRALTNDVYTDEESLEVAEAVEMAMPSLPIDGMVHGQALRRSLG